MCASGNAALLTAKMWLDAGIVDDVVVVVADLSLTPENVRHFVRLGVAVTDMEPLLACRPFQMGSSGFVMGEGSAAFVLTRKCEDSYGVLMGGAMNHDAYHATSIDPSHSRIASCVESALADAGIGPEAVSYMNTHGPGTAQCDAAESRIFDEFFPRAKGLYSFKPLAGHCQGAASGVELVGLCMAYIRGSIPAPGHVSEAFNDRLLDGTVALEGEITVKTSIGMGGYNSALIFAAA